MNSSLPDSQGPVHRRPRTSRSPVRLTVCVLLLLSILATMVMIFRFSSESKQASGDRSGRVTEMIVSVVVPHYEQRPVEEQENIVRRLGRPVRKLAHMTEYALLAMLTAAFLLAWDESGHIRTALHWIIPAAFSLLYAASDEFHQIFSNRGASVVDVLIDFLGAILGLCFFHGVCAIVRHVRMRRARRTPGAIS